MFIGLCVSARVFGLACLPKRRACLYVCTQAESSYTAELHSVFMAMLMCFILKSFIMHRSREATLHSVNHSLPFSLVSLTQMPTDIDSSKSLKMCS